MGKIIPLNIQEAKELVFYIFMQGDTRHFDNFYLNLVADFILSKAINLEKECFYFGDIKKDKQNIRGPQKIEKQNALQIIKNKNLKFIGFEIPFLDYKADILAKKGKKKIVIECGPCRIWKAIYCLEKGADLWITRDEKQTELFIFKKGKSWNKKLNEFKSKQTEELKKIPSPLDTLMEKETKENSTEQETSA